MDPIPLNPNVGTLGLGKLREDEYYTDVTNLVNKRKDETTPEETPEAKRQKEVSLFPNIA